MHRSIRGITIHSTSIAMAIKLTFSIPHNIVLCQSLIIPSVFAYSWLVQITKKIMCPTWSCKFRAIISKFPRTNYQTPFGNVMALPILIQINMYTIIEIYVIKDFIVEIYVLLNSIFCRITSAGAPGKIQALFQALFGDFGSCSFCCVM